jgi:lipopolysaccharide/colanic/teichoic acid biosynthesis glycosyltransferase
MSAVERAPQAVERRAFISRPQISRFAHSMFDVSVAALLIVLLCPLLCMAAIAILVESGRPVIFRQSRTGKDGKVFKIFKFRTMFVLEDGTNVEQAKFGDMRITGVGQWLRRTSIDELPQLFNVLKGDMSLIGPRPHAVAHDNHYAKLIPGYTSRQQVKPGITGLAQVSGARGATPHVSDMAQRVELDLLYIENRSFALDLKILILTVLTLASAGEGF